VHSRREWISGIRSERGARPSSDLGEPARSLKCKVKQAYKIPKAGGPSIFGQDTWSQINFSLTGKSKKGGAPTSDITIREITKHKVPMRSGPSDHERCGSSIRKDGDRDLECRNTSSQKNGEMRRNAKCLFGIGCGYRQWSYEGKELE
jgi:hypothetical protein